MSQRRLRVQAALTYLFSPIDKVANWSAVTVMSIDIVECVGSADNTKSSAISSLNFIRYQWGDSNDFDFIDRRQGLDEFTEWITAIALRVSSRRKQTDKNKYGTGYCFHKLLH